MKDNNSNNIESQANNLTTEQFHQLLAANTAKLNQLRLDYAQRMANAKDKYDKALKVYLSQEHYENEELRKAKKAYEEAKEKFEAYLLALRKDRHDAADTYDAAKAKIKNYWATENEKIQCERHNIFERFRESREVWTDDEAVKELLHPGWTRDKKGGDDGDKEE